MSELDQYDYDLPRDLIAQHPLSRREDARLMIVDRQRQSLDHAYIRDLPELLRPEDCLVLNDTRVLPARLVGRRARTGGRWSGLFLAEDSGCWQVIGKTRGKLAAGELLTLENQHAEPGLQLQLVARIDQGTWIVRPQSSLPTLELLEQYGRVPLPHYIRGGEMPPSDREAYQTVFAQKPGAIAAPTAGLHFTQELLERLEQRGVGRVYVTLHVGIGTFRPVTAGRLEDHKMHREWGSMGQEVVERLEQARAAGGRIIAVGTTAVRVLETAAASGKLQPWQGETDLFIRPPYAFRTTDGLLTNMHLPRSTLLVLVRTFGGDALIRRAYDLAVEQQYRFFSYGDAMLVV